MQYLREKIRIIIELQDKESIKSKAKELGVSFPNWK